MREAVRRHFVTIKQLAAAKKLAVEIVVLYKGEKNRSVMQLQLNDIEPEWMQLQQQLLGTI